MADEPTPELAGEPTPERHGGGNRTMAAIIILGLVILAVLVLYVVQSTH